MKKLITLFTFSLSLISTILLGSCGNTGVGNDKLVVGLECNYAPFNWTDTTSNESNISIDGKANQYADGYDIQIAKKISSYLNIEVVIRKLEWESLIPSLEGGEINTIIAGMTDTDERRLSIDFTDEYYRSELVLIVHKSNYTDKVLSGDDFKNYISGKAVESQVSTVTDEVIEIFSANYGATHVKPVDSFPSAANDVNSGLVFAMTAELPVAKSICRSNENLVIVHIDQSILGAKAAELGVSIGIKKGNNELKDKLNSALGAISQETRVQLMDDAVARSKE